jgi:DNA replication protein DnaC
MGVTKIVIGEREFFMKGGMRFEEKENWNLVNKKIPEKYQKLSFNDFILTESNKKIIKGLHNYALKFEKYKEKSILLVGGVGTGKTMLSCLILKTILENGYTGEFVTIVDMLDRIKQSYNPNINADFGYVDKLCKVDLLVLDDIGVEKMTEHTYEKIYKVVNNRDNNNKATIFTSNCDVLELSKILDERIISRIAGMTKNRMFMLDKDKHIDWRLK